MDSIKIQKHLAMRNYKKAQFFCIKIVVYSLAAFLSSLFYLFLFWFPTMNHFISMHLLPNIYSLFFNSKFLFILANIIIVILIADSKLQSCYNSISPTYDIYNKYVEKKRSLSLIKKQRPVSLMSTNNIMVQDQDLHLLKTVTSCNTMVLHDVTDTKKSMASRTQGQRKRSKRHVHKKTATTRDEHEYDCNVISGGELVEFVDKVINDVELQASSEGRICNGRDCNTISGGELVQFVDKVINVVELQASSEGGKCNGRDEEKIDVHHDSLQRDELNRRADEFIARVNRRRMLEAGDMDGPT